MIDQNSFQILKVRYEEFLSFIPRNFENLIKARKQIFRNLVVFLLGHKMFVSSIMY